ncbi:hypothetical protein AwPolaro_04840 [Polaromonas sp.]|nr:hypothetical protein AwPolaro_04840 [Polaromonas sp.]
MLFKKTLFAVAVLAFAGAASAQTPGFFEVKMKVIGGCNFDGPAQGVNNLGPVWLGSESGISNGTSARNATVNLSVKCTAGTDYAINLTSANAVANGTGVGLMKNSIASNTDTIAYSMHKAAGSGSPVWGNGSVPGAAISGNGVQGSGTALVNTHTVHLVSAGPIVASVGDYSDTVNISVLY